jgi:cephalosporin hydroxylase
MSGEEWLLSLYDQMLHRGESHWMGVRALKNPLDVWIYQEILFEVRPEVVIELGSAFGGGTLFFCHMLDALGSDGFVVAVDHTHAEFAAEHQRIVKVTGDTRDPRVVGRVRELAEGRRVLVVHDASHEAEVVLDDLRNYGSLVSPGSYLIVEDGVRDHLAGLPGPVAAIDRFLRESEDFDIDEARERYLLTYNPRGFLRRKGASAPAGDSGREREA